MNDKMQAQEVVAASHIPRPTSRVPHPASRVPRKRNSIAQHGQNQKRPKMRSAEGKCRPWIYPGPPAAPQGT